jgi:hypothetical protein
MSSSKAGPPILPVRRRYFPFRNGSTASGAVGAIPAESVAAAGRTSAHLPTRNCNRSSPARWATGGDVGGDAPSGASRELGLCAP